MAGKTDAFLEDHNEPVWGLTAFSEEHRLPGTLRYFKVDAMGLDFMRNTYTAEFKWDNARTTAFLTRTESADNATLRLKQYVEHAGRFGRGAELVDEGNLTFLVCDMNGLYDVVFPEGRLLGGITAIADKTRAIETGIQFRKAVRQQHGIIEPLKPDGTFFIKGPRELLGW